MARKPLQSITNRERAEAIEDVLVVALDGDSNEELVVDALTHLRHLCDRDGLDFAALDAQAQRHYLEETKES